MNEDTLDFSYLKSVCEKLKTATVAIDIGEEIKEKAIRNVLEELRNREYSDEELFEIVSEEFDDLCYTIRKNVLNSIE